MTESEIVEAVMKDIIEAYESDIVLLTEVYDDSDVALLREAITNLVRKTIEEVGPHKGSLMVVKKQVGGTIKMVRVKLKSKGERLKAKLQRRLNKSSIRKSQKAYRRSHKKQIKMHAKKLRRFNKQHKSPAKHESVDVSALKGLLESTQVSRPESATDLQIALSEGYSLINDIAGTLAYFIEEYADEEHQEFKGIMESLETLSDSRATLMESGNGQPDLAGFLNQIKVLHGGVKVFDEYVPYLIADMGN